jgi:hypothetical protein
VPFALEDVHLGVGGAFGVLGEHFLGDFDLS